MSKTTLQNEIVRDRFPYVESGHPMESNGHIYLKNVAIHWLLNRGFELEDIELERNILRDEGYPKGRTDVYASNGSVEAFVECEKNFTGNPNTMSSGGRTPAKEGKSVYVVTDKIVYRIKKTTVVATNQWGNKPMEREVLTAEPYSGLPLLPV